MKFGELDAWKAARKIVKELYAPCKHGQLASDFGLRDPIQRAAVSFMTNIAERFERSGLQEKLQYNISRVSCGEVRTLLYVVEDHFPHLSTEAIKLRSNCNQFQALISGLIGSTQKCRTL